MQRVIQRIALVMALVAFLVSISLWIFRPPKQFSSKHIEWVATAQVVPPLSFINSPDTSASQDICMPFDATDVAVLSIDAVIMVLESIINDMSIQAGTTAEAPPYTLPSFLSTGSYFLRVNQRFSSEAEAVEYADSILSEHDVDECWMGVRGTVGNQRFTLLVGPFRTRKDAIKPQSRLTGAKIPTLLVDESFLRRFHSVTPIPDLPQPVISSIASISIPPTKPQGLAIFPPWPDQFPVLIL